MVFSISNIHNIIVVRVAVGCELAPQTLASEHSATNLLEADQSVASRLGAALHHVPVAATLLHNRVQQLLLRLQREHRRDQRELQRGGGQQCQIRVRWGELIGKYRVADSFLSLDTLGRVLRYAANYKILENIFISLNLSHHVQISQISKILAAYKSVR